MSTMILGRHAQPTTPPAGAGWNPMALLTRAVDMFDAAVDRIRQRRQLAGLDDQMLKDVGLSRADADAEYRKGFWQA